MSLFGEVRVVEDVAQQYATIVHERLAASSADAFLLATSGSGSGSAAQHALGARPDVDLSRIALYYIDERCVDLDSDQRNANTIKNALGPRYHEFRWVHEMSCPDGPQAYAELLQAAGPFDVIQLGLGPDGHTASIFPGPLAPGVQGGPLVIRNNDPSGTNLHDRLTWTYPALDAARLAIFTVAGPDKVDAISRIAAGEDLPAARVRSNEVIWLLDTAAAQGLFR